MPAVAEVWTGWSVVSVTLSVCLFVCARFKRKHHEQSTPKLVDMAVPRHALTPVKKSTVKMAAGAIRLQFNSLCYCLKAAPTNPAFIVSRNLSSHIDMHTHACWHSTLHNPVTWPFDLTVNACWGLVWRAEVVYLSQHGHTNIQSHRCQLLPKWVTLEGGGGSPTPPLHLQGGLLLATAPRPFSKAHCATLSLCVCVCVCAWCVVNREPCTVFGSVPSLIPALFLFCQATQLPGFWHRNQHKTTKFSSHAQLH